MVDVSVRMDAREYAALKNLAEMKEMSVSSLMRLAFATYHDIQKLQKPGEDIVGDLMHRVTLPKKNISGSVG